MREEHRPWGYYLVLADEGDHKVKRIVVRPGCRTSLQRHARRSEHWYVIDGSVRITLDGTSRLLNCGENIDIPAHVPHRLHNEGNHPAVIIEIQRGDYFGEDDIERIEDDYGRVRPGAAG